MTPDELRAALHAPRLPEAFAALGPRDLLAALGVGLILSALLWLLLRPAAARIEKPDLAAELDQLKNLPPAERQARRARLIGRLGGTLPADLGAGLYRPAPPSPEAEARLDRLARDAIRRRG